MFFSWKDSLTPRKQASAERAMLDRISRLASGSISHRRLSWRRLLRAGGDIVELVAEWEEDVG